MISLRPLKGILTRIFFYAIEGVTLVYMLLQLAHISKPYDAKFKKPFAIAQMVIVTLLVTALITIAFIIAIISLIKWSYKKSGAKSFLKSRAKKY